MRVRRKRGLGGEGPNEGGRGDQDWVCGWLRVLRGGELGGWWVGGLKGGGQVFLLRT